MALHARNAPAGKKNMLSGKYSGGGTGFAYAAANYRRAEISDAETLQGGGGAVFGPKVFGLEII